MVLGGITPVQVQTRQAVQTNNPQAPAQTNSAVSSGNEQVNQGTPGGDFFTPENLKKWAPWIVGAVLLYVLLNKKR